MEVESRESDGPLGVVAALMAEDGTGKVAVRPGGLEKKYAFVVELEDEVAIETSVPRGGCPATVEYSCPLDRLTEGRVNRLVEAYRYSLRPNTSGGRGIPNDSATTLASTIGEESYNQTQPQVSGRLDEITSRLEEKGAAVIAPGDVADEDGAHCWEDLGGYEAEKARLKETILMALKNPEVLGQVMKGTRERGGRNRPKAVLFTGPPGCGKTTAAKILASEANVFFVHIPIEAIVSKWYGESERRLAELLELCNSLGSTVLVFIDEIDSLAPTREQTMHEASRKQLSVLLRFLDGLSGEQPSMLLAATNRPGDLDPALLSRFDVTVSFGLPDFTARRAMLALHAKQLAGSELDQLATAATGLSGRRLVDVCGETERRFASRLVSRGTPAATAGLPALDDYLETIATSQPAREPSR